MKNVFDILDELDNRYENKDWSINEAIELAIEETSKAKDEEFIKILNEILSIIGDISVSDSLEKLDFVYFLIKKTEFEKASEKLKEIKQRIKENEE